MAGEFTFNNISSAKYGVVLADPWIDPIPATDYVGMDVDGRNGARYYDLHRKDVTKDIACTMRDPQGKRLADVAAWLHGSGYFELNGRRRMMHIYDQIDISRVGWSHKSFTISAILEPFWHAATDTPTEITTTGSGSTYTAEITNNGDAAARPVFYILCASAVDITINGLKFSYAGGTSALKLDCANCEESDPSAITIGYEYPTLKPGTNTITTTQAVTFTVYDKDWWYTAC